MSGYRHSDEEDEASSNSKDIGPSKSSEPGRQRGERLDWDSLSDKNAKTMDNYELGKVKQVRDEYIYTENDKLEKFFIPRRFVDRFDGNTLWFSITRTEAETQFSEEL